MAFVTTVARSRVFQCLLLIALWAACEAVSRALPLPFPGGVLAMGVLLVLLLTGVVPVVWVRAGAMFMISHMVLFLVPLVTLLFWHSEFLGWLGVKVMVVVAVGTVAVIASTALSMSLSVSLTTRWRARHDAH